MHVVAFYNPAKKKGLKAMKITDELYLETRIYDENNREAWLVNNQTGKEIRIACVFVEGEQWLVGDLYRFLVEPSRKEAMSAFNYIVAMTVDNLNFLYR